MWFPIMALTGCGPANTLPVSDVCGQYLDCLAATDPHAVQGLLGIYGAGGSCWDDATAAADCDAACGEGLAAADAPDEPACDGTRPVDDWDWPFSAGGWRLTYTAFVENTCDSGAKDPSEYFEIGVDYVAYPSFYMDLLTGLECTVFREDFSCEPIEIGATGQVLSLGGTFLEQALGEGTVLVEDSDCGVEVAYVLTRRSDSGG